MNMTVGKHETIQELHRGAICSIYSARKVGTPEGEDGASLAIKICQPPVEVLGEAAVGSVISGFLESARLQLGLAQLPAAGANRWLKIHEVVEAHGPQLGGEYGLPTAKTGAIPSGLGGVLWHQPILPTDSGAGRVASAPLAHVLLETVALAAYQDSESPSLGRRFENCDPTWRQ